MRRLLSIAATALALSVAPAVAQEVVNFTIDGTNLDGSTYGGTATITWISDSTCTIVWNSGPDPVEGICMRNGPAFSAGYSMGDKVGLVIYQVFEDGHMEGLWTIAGTNGLGTEILTPQ